MLFTQISHVKPWQGVRVTKATVSSRENAVRVCEVVAEDNVQQLVLSNPARKKQR